MQREESRAEYRRRIYRVLEYLDRHLDQPLELRTLAEVAYFSPFHFHRLFNAWMGMTLGDYMRKRRIEMGALKLMAQPRLSILQVAVSVGFFFSLARRFLGLSASAMVSHPLNGGNGLASAG